MTPVTLMLSPCICGVLYLLPARFHPSSHFIFTSSITIHLSLNSIHHGHVALMKAFSSATTLVWLIPGEPALSQGSCQEVSPASTPKGSEAGRGRTLVMVEENWGWLCGRALGNTAERVSERCLLRSKLYGVTLPPAPICYWLRAASRDASFPSLPTGTALGSSGSPQL